MYYNRNTNTESGFKGVFWDKSNKKWRSEINTGGKKYYLGLFTDKQIAIEKWKNKAEELGIKWACVTEGFKRCNKCNSIKELEQFDLCYKSNDGRQAYCHECNKGYYEENKESILEHQKEYVKENRSHVKEVQRSYRVSNRSLLRENGQRNYRQNREQILAREKARYWSDPERKKEYDRTHRKQSNERKRRYGSILRKTDKAWSIRQSLSGRLARIIRNIGSKKASNTMDLVGCDKGFLAFHLQGLWLPGMTWENYGSGERKWVVDHIRPCKTFDFLNPDHQRLCFHFKNLQPLWGTDNAKKGSKYDKPLYPTHEFAESLRQHQVLA